MQALNLKIDKTSGEKGCKWYQFTYFLTNISPRTERELEHRCKIKDNDLSF